MAYELSTTKSICILGVVVCCFAILWPSIFYPMLKGSLFPSIVDDGCCDVLLDKDVNGVKLINELCSSVLKSSDKYSNNLYFQVNFLNKDAIKYCRKVVLDTCGIDIQNLLKDKIQLNPGYKHVLEEIRTFNKSLCLKYHFDLTLDLLGAPHRVKKLNFTSSKYHRQERTPFVRPESLHPAFRERGRAVPPQKEKIYREQKPSPVKSSSTNKPPIPGMRPPIGGSGHIVPQPKGSGAMGILMPIYTAIIVLFFGYTILKLISKKQDSSISYTHDPEFCRVVFNNNAYSSKVREKEKTNGSLSNNSSPKLGDIEINQLRKRLAETEAAMERIVKQINLVSQSLPRVMNETENLMEKVMEEENSLKFRQNETHINTDGNDEIEVSKNLHYYPNELTTITEETERKRMPSEYVEKINGTVEVIGMELNESCKDGSKWSPVLPVKPENIEIIEVKPHEIILPATVPINSQILISDAHTEENISTDSSVVLESKVTLNVISPELNDEEIAEKDIVIEKYENKLDKCNLKEMNSESSEEDSSEDHDHENNDISSESITDFLKYQPNTEL